MTKRRILKLNKDLLKNKKIITANAPNLVHFPLMITGKKSKLLVEVEEDVKFNQSLAKLEGSKHGLNSSISGKIKHIEEHEQPDASYDLVIKIENKFKKVTRLKRLVSPSVAALNYRIIEAGLFELSDMEEKEIYVNCTDTSRTLGLNEFVLNNFTKQILKGANLIKKAFKKPNIEVLVKKEQVESLIELVKKLNLKGVIITSKKSKNKEAINIQTALDFYEAVSAGQISHSKIIAVAGESIKTPSYYLVTLGTPINELIDLCGPLKYEYKEIEAFKDQAMLALNDEIQIKQEIKEEDDKLEKEILKRLLIEKKLEAKTKIFKYFKENQKKYGLCLSNMMFSIDNKLYSAKSPTNSVLKNVDAVLFLSNNEYKNKHRNTK
jgi:Na+-translocating ferredoxin:NAD+ oxidoreductase RnfC subunit